MRTMQAALLAATLLSAGGLAACGGGGENAEAQESTAEAPRAVRVAVVAERPIGGGLSVSGRLVAREEAAVSTEVAGYRVARVLVEEGDWVRAGQALAVLDQTLLRSDVAAQQAQVARAEASVAQAQVQATQAQGEAARVAGLVNQGVLSQEAIEARRAAAASARAAVQAARADAAAARAQLGQLQTRLQRTAVTAPFAGQVLERNVRAGEVTGGGAQPMFRIARAGMIELDAEVAEAQLARLQPGQPATVRLPSGASIQGTVRYIDPTVDPQTRLGRARISLPGSPELRLGGFATADVSDLSAPGKVVPEAAVQFDADGAYVLVVGADSRVRRVPVRTGRRSGEMVELVQGPPVGARVVLSGSSFIVEGDAVRPILAAAAPPSRAAAAGAARSPAR